jgi:hypothetical protein
MISIANLGWSTAQGLAYFIEYRQLNRQLFLFHSGDRRADSLLIPQSQRQLPSHGFGRTERI